MKHIALLTLMMTLLLAGCGGQEEAEFEAWRQEALAAPLHFDAALTVVSETGETAYSAACRYAAGETEVTLTAPELLAGVRVRCGADGGELAYDGAILLLPAAAFSGMDPCAALPRLMEALETGRLRSLAREDGLPVAELELTNGAAARLWRDERGSPTHAELTENGVTVVFCNITNWTVG